MLSLSKMLYQSLRKLPSFPCMHGDVPHCIHKLHYMGAWVVSAGQFWDCPGSGDRPSTLTSWAARKVERCSDGGRYRDGGPDRVAALIGTPHHSGNSATVAPEEGEFTWRTQQQMVIEKLALPRPCKQRPGHCTRDAAGGKTRRR